MKFLIDSDDLIDCNYLATLISTSWASTALSQELTHSKVAVSIASLPDYRRNDLAAIQAQGDVGIVLKLPTKVLDDGKIIPAPDKDEASVIIASIIAHELVHIRQGADADHRTSVSKVKAWQKNLPDASQMTVGQWVQYYSDWQEFEAHGVQIAVETKLMEQHGRSVSCEQSWGWERIDERLTVSAVLSAERKDIIMANIKDVAVAQLRRW
ncbi:hypothetical protein [Azospirillum argentinense]|uniref:Uncharacterized protein n=1 Tax=Azospirillum argentinense TaxID=2970906 RepID=A0A5B0KPX8_9PROT|nr:hypothetical protein [Azospirillum argentinense]KAA1053803.1 hypothetical protein FH063_002385 [Azospirillum argentinense]